MKTWGLLSTSYNHTIKARFIHLIVVDLSTEIKCLINGLKYFFMSIRNLSEVVIFNNRGTGCLGVKCSNFGGIYIKIILLVKRHNFFCKYIQCSKFFFYANS